MGESDELKSIADPDRGLRWWCPRPRFRAKWIPMDPSLPLCGFRNAGWVGCLGINRDVTLLTKTAKMYVYGRIRALGRGSWSYNYRGITALARLYAGDG